MNKEELALLSDEMLNALSNAIGDAVGVLKKHYGKDRLKHVSYTGMNAFYNMIEVELIRRAKIKMQEVMPKPLKDRK